MNPTEKKPYNTNRDLSAQQVIDRITTERPGIVEHVRIVGRWVWAEFDSKPEADVREYLSALGFYWNRKRSAWQHNGGCPTKKAKGYDPREKYGSVPLAAILEDQQTRANRPRSL